MARRPSYRRRRSSTPDLPDPPIYPPRLLFIWDLDGSSVTREKFREKSGPWYMAPIVESDE